MSEKGPLAGLLVVDLTRMLPGAVLVRTLVDLGARVLKIEDPSGGDPLRSTPPLVDGVSAAFCTFFRGVESVALDLKTPEGVAELRKIARHADVLLESFRPGTLEKWGLSPARLLELNPVLVTCSLSAFGSAEPFGRDLAHDLNTAAQSGFLTSLRLEHPAAVQIADVTTGLLAVSAILAALFRRERTHRGMHVEQPLALGPQPFLTWAWAEAAAGAGTLANILSGRVPAYRLYDARDGRIAVAALEPKFWVELVNALALPHLAGDGLDLGERGAAAFREVAAAIAREPRERWLALAKERGLPISAVNEIAAAMKEPFYESASEATPLPGGGTLQTPGAYLPSFRGRPLGPAPRLGADTERVLAELGAR